MWEMGDVGLAEAKTRCWIRILGPVQVERDGAEVDLGSPKQRGVLAILLAESGAISRDRIIEGVWGEDASPANRHSLQTYVSNLRRILGGVIVRSGETYRLDLGSDDVDHLQFARVVEGARSRVATDAATTASELREALGWWRGRPYADLVDIPGLQAEIRRLEELRLEAVELRIDAELASGLHGSLIAELDALAEEYPFRERFRAQHMLALYRSGRQSDALRAYRRTESFLAEELGVAPSSELQDLELKILDHDASLLGGSSRSVTQRLAFLVTDIEGSTRLWDQHHQEMASALADHDRILRKAVEAQSGTVFKHTGDGVLAVFPDAAAATAAAETAQRDLSSNEWGEIGDLRVRMGIDVGEAETRGSDFFGPPLNRAARLCAIGHGGQVLLSAGAQSEVLASAPVGLQFRQLGEVHLRGMAHPEPVTQLVFVGLPADFPNLRLNVESALDERSEVLSLPGYEARDRLGEGAFGVVWRAYQPSVGREVAVKVIRSELASQSSFVRRFEAEARTIARLAHPHIVPLIDFWRDTDSAYLVLALLSGGSLASAMSSGKVDRKSARRMLGQLGSALDYAHSQGMVHGDVKPSNVLLDGAGNAYLSDFGIAARLLYPELARSASLAPEYRAPEEPTTGPSTAADVFALGMLARDLLDDVADIEPVLARATAANPDDRYPSATAMLTELDEALGEEHTGVDLPAVSRNPYKGLRAFDEADAADFHGRDELVATLLTALSERRFVAVVGPSGSGKSSVVKAGLLPKLSNGAIDGSDRWFRVTLKPGPDPVASLAEGIETASAVDVGTEQLAEEGLGRVVDGELLLVIDQFEEVYTLATADQRDSFLRLVADAAEDPATEVRVVVTLRADFYDRPLEDDRLGRLVRDGLVTVLPPTREELVEMITGPSQAVGLRWEPGLPHLIAEDVVHQSGGLPLLQYALTELVERRAADLLTSSDYENSGGVARALANRAEAVFGQLEPSQQRVARQVLLRLVTVDEDSDDVRRPVRRSELETMDIARTDLDVVLDRFTSQRLFLADRDPATRSPTVEVAHEALLREWPRLRGWIDDQREALILGRRFRTALAEWEKHDRNSDYLLTGARIAPFAGWAETTSLTIAEQAYYRASRDKDDKERTARRRRRRTLTAVLAGAAVVASTLGLVAMLQAQQASEEAHRANLEADRARRAEAEAAREAERAEREAETARARELSAAAIAALETDPALAKLLAVASADLAAPTGDAISVLHQAYGSDRIIERYPLPQDRETIGYLWVDIHPDGNQMVVSGGERFLPSRVLVAYDLPSGEVRWSWETDHPLIVVSNPVYSMDGASVIAGVFWDLEGSAGGEEIPSDLLGVHVWDADTGEVARRIETGRCGGTVAGVSSGRALVHSNNAEDCTERGMSIEAKSWELVDLESGERQELEAGSDALAVLSGDGRYLAFIDGPRAVVVDIEAGERVLEYDAARALGSAAPRLLNHDGSLLIAGFGRPFEVWDVVERRLVATFSGHAGEAEPWAFTPDGESVYSVGREGTVRLWNARRGTEVAAYPSVGAGNLSITAGGLGVVADDNTRRVSLLDFGSTGEVWEVETCSGFVLGDTLQIVENAAVLTAWCTGDEYLTTFVVDLAGQTVVATYPGQATQDLRVSPDGDRFVRQVDVEPPEGSERPYWIGPPLIADLDTGTIAVELQDICTWDPDSPTPPWQQPGCAEYPNTPFPMWAWRFEWSPNSSLVVGVNDYGFDDWVAVWEADTGRLVAAPEPCSGPPASTRFTPDGSELVVGCIGGELVALSTEIWEPTRSALIPVEEVAPFLLLGFNRDESLFLVVVFAGFGSGSVHWVDAVTLEVQHSILSAHEGSIKSAAFSPDRSRIATGSSDGWVKVWDVDGRVLEQSFHIGPSQIQGLAFIADDHLAVSPESGGVYVYTLDPEELLEVVRSSLIRGFTDLECQQYNFGDDCPSLEELKLGR
jgi:DNA-binding SARP family transcriptional activator/WD40 repeat protein/energy-coupling factor transporter ATP-binding protein EcfA2